MRKEEYRPLLPVQFEDLILDEKPVLTTDYKFNFPVLAEKNDVDQYYKKGGYIPYKNKTLHSLS